MEKRWQKILERRLKGKRGKVRKGRGKENENGKE